MIIVSLVSLLTPYNLISNNVLLCMSVISLFFASGISLYEEHQIIKNANNNNKSKNDH
jgi:CHASE3 domain sensor protein